MNIKKKEYVKLLETVKILYEQQNSIMDAMEQMIEEIHNENDNHYNKLKDEIDDIKDLLGIGKTYHARISTSKFENNINKELSDIKRMLKSFQSTMYGPVYNDVKPTDEIICAIKDYYDSKDCY